MATATAITLGFLLGCGFTLAAFVLLSVLAMGAQRESELPDEPGFGDEWSEPVKTEQQ